MKMNLTKNDINKLIDLLQVRQINVDVSEMYLYYTMEQSTSINKNMVDRYLKRSKSIEEAFYYAFLEVMDLDPKDQELKIVENTCNINSFKKLDVNKYINNPYYKRIKAPQVKSGKWNFQYDTFKPYEAFMYNEITINEKHLFEEKSAFGFFTEPFRYLTIAQGDDIWMSVTPHEIETMEESIKEASGNVAVFGLGLGYCPYMISLKDDVKKITIVEIDKHAVDLFNTYILPQFEYKDKIEVILMDAFKFAKTKMNDVDYAFVDLWHNVEDGVPLYLEMKAIEKDIKDVKFSYWIEESLLTFIRRNLLTILDEVADGATKENYIHAENFEDELINKMYFYFEKIEINSFDDILKILSKENLLEMVKHLF